MYSASDRAVLERHVTDVDRNVYCIVNLPEEVIAVIFAYVSRSPRSFRDNLLHLLKSGEVQAHQVQSGNDLFASAAERAAAFHSRWVVGYGHSSVAEHAVAHLGVEKISRIASAELELANPFISFTEYSQRYQKPERGDFYTPDGLPVHLYQSYQDTMLSLYDTYETLYQGLFAYLDQNQPEVAGESNSARQARLSKVAFEDARYVLPLATLTNLGLTGNGRALRDAFAQMQASSLPESRTLAQQMIVQVTKILPTLLRHSEPSPYQLRLGGQVTSRGQLGDSYSAGPEVELISYTGKGVANPEVAALEILNATLTGNDEAIGDEHHVLSLVEGLGGHDALPELFSWIRYDCRMVMSEAAWHQLLRHTRGMSFQWGPPEIGNGYTVPPNVVAAGLQDKVSKAVMQAEIMYKDIYNEVPELAGYAVTNAHRRRIRSEFDLRQLYHLVNLRVSEHAQWDIKDAIRQLWHQVQQVHPRLGAQASRRS